MKKERQFLHDLHRRRVYSIPFIELFQNNKDLRKELFLQYLKTDLKPDYDLYLNSHYSQKELEERFSEVGSRIPLSRIGMASFVPQTDFENSLHHLKKKFVNLSANDELPEEFKKHSIEDTLIIRKLKKEKIQDLIQDFNLYTTWNKDPQTKEYAEAFAKNFLNLLPKLNNNLLSKLILEDFIEKQQKGEERIAFLIDNRIDADNAKRKYRELTMFANNIIYDYIRTLKIENQHLSNNVISSPIHRQISQTESSPLRQKNTGADIKYQAKHFVLTYLIECNAKGDSFPVGQKKELERIGNERMGIGKGNRFYKVFNEIVSKDLNSEKYLIEIGGENWRTIVKALSTEPETIETYLQSKQL